MSLEVNTSCLQEHHISRKSIWQIFIHELGHHVPYGTLSVAFALMLLSMIAVLFNLSEMAHHGHGCCGSACGMSTGLDILFHSFHFAHILFAASGTMITFYRYSNRLWSGIFIGIVSSIVFCTIADILLPYAAGRLLGVEMELHICFKSELANILPFLGIGIINGIIIPRGKEGHTEHHSSSLHFVHTFISAMASIFYAIGHGLENFYDYLGIFFVLMLITVVIPCTLSDVVVPVLWARMVNKK